MDDIEELYPCIGICMADPDSGRCQGCGRPLAEPAAPPAPPPATPAQHRDGDDSTAQTPHPGASDGRE